MVFRQAAQLLALGAALTFSGCQINPPLIRPDLETMAATSPALIHPLSGEQSSTPRQASLEPADCPPPTEHVAASPSAPPLAQPDSSSIYISDTVTTQPPVEMTQSSARTKPLVTPGSVSRYENKEAPSSTASRLDLHLERFRLELPRYPGRRGFDLSSVTYTPLYGDTSLTFPNTPPSGFRYRSPFFENDYGDPSRDFDPRILAYVPKEIVRRLAADGNKTARDLYHMIRTVERIGDRLRDVERAVRGLFTLDLTNIVEEITDPGHELRELVEGRSRHQSISGDEYNGRSGLRPYPSPIVSAELVAAINEDPIGSRTVGHIYRAISQNGDLSYGIIWNVEIKF